MKRHRLGELAWFICGVALLAWTVWLGLMEQYAGALVVSVAAGAVLSMLNHKQKRSGL